ncbi:filamentous hemagglutinin [Polaromonas sp. YR568]|uniref:two-partner secretion domain-containing protein n=1 Tax=Polaromonas sp. YR568 TaxID=1855301 RepID=UPI0008E785A0|nr:hemagglutinin repeat-containing protein [Polaromonas sp. YR568]SFU80309.1 filamentous hemagglutinin [Polaromonas sp. YR568]
MNKNLHRIVFNAKRGQRMAVAETASAQGKAASGDTAGGAGPQGLKAGLHPLRFAVLSALGLVLWLQPAAFTAVHAQIIAAPGAPAGQRPTVLQTANGLPQVNIQTPSAAGVSRNTYSQFDVQQNGAILNNSRTNVQTQLGGFVGANPWLATGPARVILNEVQSANPSQIRGYVEVAGQRAEVIIANPAGINVNGGGFLNASRVTLTTGSPIINGGALDGFRVQGGNITVGGAGLDTSTADYTGILARAVQVNAGIWAKELRVATGANDINADHTSATPIAGAGAAPTYAVDVAQVGGMYAGKIFLIGSETGLGVRNAGVIAATGGELVLQANGWLTNSGTLQAAGAVQANTQGAIANTGTVYANGNTTLAAQGGISNSGSGVIAAQGHTSLQATGAGAAITSAVGSVVAAGLNPDGTLTPGGALSVSAAGALSLNGQTVAGGNAGLSGAQVDLADGKLSGQSISVTASAGSVDASRATVNAQGTLSASAAQTLRTDGAVVSANQLSLAAQDISNAGGEIVQTGTDNTTIALTSPTGTLNNSAGRIATNSQNLTLSAPTLVNTDGKIEHAGSGTLAINATTFSGDRGTVVSTGAVNLAATSINHSNATLSAAGVNITAGTLNNRSGTINQSGLGAASVTATGALDNSAGKILSNGNTTVSAQSLNNQGGVIQATGASSLGVTTTAALDNSANGQIAAGGTATLSTGSLNNTLGKVTAGADLNASATGAATNVQGLLASNGAATLTAASVDNTRGVIASVQNNVNATTTGATVNDSGRIEAADDITLANAGLSNTQAAGQTAAGSITGRSIAINTGGQTLNNAFGTIAAAQGATLQTGAVNNNAGLIQAGAALGINTNGQTLTNADAASYASGAGGITSQGVMTLTTGDLNNTAGFMGAKAALNATTAAVSNTAAGQIVGESSVSFTSTGFDNRGGQVQALGDAGINAGAGTINNAGGLLRSAATTTLAAASVINSNTLGANQGIEGNNVAITAGAISNNSGAIRTSTNAILTSGGTLNNTAGLVSAGNTATVQDTAANPAARTLAITNTGGTIVAGRSLAASAASLSGAGSLLSQQDLSLSLGGDFSNTGTISATGNNTVNVTGTLTNSGKLQAGATLDVTAATIDNTATGEMIGTTTKITATAANTLINRGLIDGVDTQINTVTLNNIGTGRIYGNTVSIAATTVNNDAETVGGVTTAATIAARQRLDIGATTINNSNGALIFSAGDMAIGDSLDGARRATGQATLIKNASATIESLGAMSLAANSIQNTNPSFSYTLSTIGPVSKMDFIARDGTAYASSYFAWTTTGRLEFSIGGRGSLTDLTIIGGQLPNSPYAAPIYKTYYEGPDAFQAEYTTPPSGDSNNGAYFPDVLNYQNTDPVWALFGMPNPSNANPGARPTRTWVGSQDQGGFVDPTPEQIAAWEVASAPWQALQIKLNDFRAAAGAYLMGFPVYRSYTETDQTAVVNAGKPAQILSGGNMTLNASGTLLNDNSRIIAGGVLTATAQAVNNQATQITAVQSRSGSITRFGVTGESCDFLGCDTQYGFIVDPYAQNIPHTIATGIAVSQSNAAVPGTGTVLASLTPGSVSTAPGAIGTPSAAARSAGIVQVTSSVGALGSLAANVPVVRTVAPNIGIPNTSLFRTNPGPASAFLIETDPRFANYRTWLGSDYMLGQLTLDPAVTQKRLGDGFYEQRLINEQIAQLTGQRFLGNYTSEEVQYKALMDAGITYATQMNLRPGIALTAVQMAALTSDIVWLVEQTVTLPDGSTQRVLVPQVYVRVRAGDVDGAGTLLAGREINLNLAGDLTNTGTVAGRTVMALTAENIHNLSGRISGNAVAITARTDLNNIGGQIDAANSLNVAAGRDLNIVSTTTALTTTGSTVGPTVSSFSGIDRVAGLYITNPGGTLLASAGRDMNLVAGVIQSQGSAQLQAGNNLNLTTVTQTDSVDATRDERNYTRWSQTQDIGSQISATGNVSLNAGKDINTTAASITSEQGALVTSAGNNVNITAGRSDRSLATSSYVEGESWANSSSQEVRQTASASTATGSSLSGNTVTVVSGKDINVKGSSVVSDAGTTLGAGNNLTIESATNTSSQTNFKERKESGMTLEDGLFVGSKEHTSSQQGNGTTAAASTVGSINGNVTLQAGEAYKQVGSDVIAPAGDITILAKTVDIVEARETNRYESEEKFKQSGLTISASNAMVSALETGQQMADAASNTSDGRMQALAGAAAAFKGYNTYKGLTDAAGNFDAKAAADISINFSYGSSESQSKSSSQSNNATGSTVAAGNNLTIVATGAGQASNLTARGATLTAGNNVTLLADNQVNLLASQSNASQESSNSSSSSSVTVSYNVISKSVGFSASASQSEGNSNGADTSYTNTQVTAGNTASIISGGDTNLIGAVVAANTVKANVGGNLNIQSLQDTSTYTSEQSSSGASISVGKGSAGGGSVTGGGISASESNIDSNYASVVQQSGIKAGDGGFQVAVAGNTDLKGSVIASTQAAVEQGKNSFSTGGTLSISDIQNTASYEGKAMGLSIDVGQQAGKFGVNGVGAGIGSDKGEASSTSSSGISGIAGNTAVRSTDAETGIAKIFDADRVQREVNAQVQITQAFSKEAPKATASFAAGQAADLRKAGKEEEAKKWDEGGVYRIALHTLTGAFSGGVGGAAGGAASASAANLMNNFQDGIQKSLEDAGMSAGAAKALAQSLATVTAASIGAAVGGAQGAATAATVDANNRQLHKDEIALAKKYAKQVAKAGGISEEEATARIERQLLRWTNAATNASDGGRVDELVVGQIGISGKDTATGMQWDYRNYAQTHPNEYFDAAINQQNVGQYSPLLATSNYGLTPAQIAQRAHDGIVTTLTAAACGFTGVGCAAMSGFNIGEGGIKLANGETLAGSIQTAGGFLGLGASLYGPVSAAIKNGANGGGVATTVITPEMETKILFGERVINASGSPTNRVIGAHGGEITNANPNYAVEVLSVNADGTRNAKLVTQFSDGNLSNIKTSTLFPEGWTRAESIGAVKQVGDMLPVATRADGATLYQSTINGVKIEVIKVGSNVTAGYPVGSRGFQTTTYFLTGKN